MPMFQYKCDTCNADVTRIVKYDDRKIVTLCHYITCNGKLHFVDKIHKTGVQFKGKGWFNSGGY